MDVTDEQVAAIKPLLQRAAQAKRAEYHALNAIETLLDSELEGIDMALTNLGPVLSEATTLTDADVRDFLADCAPVTRTTASR